MNLVFDMWDATMSGERRHPQRAMKDLGITYAKAVPQSIAEQWWFFGCEGMPEDLPCYLRELTASSAEIWWSASGCAGSEMHKMEILKEGV